MEGVISDDNQAEGWKVDFISIFSAMVVFWDIVFLLWVGLGVRTQLNLERTQYLKTEDLSLFWS